MCGSSCVFKLEYIYIYINIFTLFTAAMYTMIIWSSRIVTFNQKIGMSKRVMFNFHFKSVTSNPRVKQRVIFDGS